MLRKDIRFPSFISSLNRKRTAVLWVSGLSCFYTELTGQDRKPGD